MKTNYEIRYAAHPEDAKSYDTARIRRDFLIEKIFVPNEVNMVYSMYDRMVVGGALPVGEVLTLEAIDPLKAPFFLTRREMGIYNVGGPGVVKAGDAVFELDYKEALYLDVEPEVSQKLMEKRYGGDNSKKDLHEKNLRFLLDCRKSAVYAAKKCGWKVINCCENGEIKSIEKISEEIERAAAEIYAEL